MFYIMFFMCIGLVVATCTLFAIYSKKINEKILKRCFKIGALLLAISFIVVMMWKLNHIEQAVWLLGSDLDSNFIISICMVIHWFTIAAVLVLCLSAFYKLKISKKLITYFVLPVAALNIIFFRWNIIALDGASAINNFDLRILFYTLQTILLATMSFIYVWKTREFKMSWKELLVFSLALLGILAVAMPGYALQTLFGPGPKIAFLDFTFAHRTLLYLGFIFPAIVYLIAWKKDMDTKRFVVLYICLAALVTFTHSFPFSNWFAGPKDWPLHLCNTAMYILPLCIIFKWEKIFYFTLFINVCGAFFAMLWPNHGSTTMFDPGQYIFWINHWVAFFMPFVCVALGLFPRAKWKHFSYSMIGFFLYFVLIIFLNALLDRDFFFTNSDFIAGKLGKWAKDLLLTTVTLKLGSNQLDFYPIYQSLFFLVYVGIGFVMWFIYENAYNIFGNVHALMERKNKIKLDELALKIKMQLEGRSMSEPINPKGTESLRVINFSKKYGSSKTFAVENANLEIHSGEIFGFLGPNGAGKSTIIKSIVGIQPITKGSIEICGYDVEKQSVDAKRNIGYVPDHYALYERLTAREYINYIADIYKVSTAARDERINHFLDIFEFEHAFNNQIRTFSHGMKQKIAIMAALIHEPKIWILDEPLTGLDPNSIFQVKETMKEYAAKGNIVFFSSHIIDVVERICDRIAIIKKGTIVVDDVNIKDLNKKGMKLEDLYIKHVGKKGAER